MHHIHAEMPEECSLINTMNVRSFIFMCMANSRLNGERIWVGFFKLVGEDIQWVKIFSWQFKTWRKNN